MYHEIKAIYRVVKEGSFNFCNLLKALCIIITFAEMVAVIYIINKLLFSADYIIIGQNGVI